MDSKNGNHHSVQPQIAEINFIFCILFSSCTYPSYLLNLTIILSTVRFGHRVCLFICLKSEYVSLWEPHCDFVKWCFFSPVVLQRTKILIVYCNALYIFLSVSSVSVLVAQSFNSYTDDVIAFNIPFVILTIGHG